MFDEHPAGSAAVPAPRPFRLRGRSGSAAVPAARRDTRRLCPSAFAARGAGRLSDAGSFPNLHGFDFRTAVATSPWAENVGTACFGGITTMTRTRRRLRYLVAAFGALALTAQLGINSPEAERPARN